MSISAATIFAAWSLGKILLWRPRVAVYKGEPIPNPSIIQRTGYSGPCYWVTYGLKTGGASYDDVVMNLVLMERN